MKAREVTAVALASAGMAEALRRLVELAGATASLPWLTRRHPVSRSSVVAVVPARDEAALIGECVASLLAQEPPLAGVVVVDDMSTDGTAGVARAAAVGSDVALLVVSAVDVGAAWGGPPGKPAACQAGADAAAARFPDAEWVCFVDADVRLAPGAVARLVGSAQADSVEATSLIGGLVGGDLGCRLVLPDFGLAIITGEGNPRRVNDDARPECVASGQCFAIDVTAYRAVGGHRSVAGEVLEDGALAARLVGHGYRHRLRLGQGLMEVRMYASFAALWDGLAKNLAGLRGSRRSDVARQLWRLLAPTWLPLAAVALDPRGRGGRLGIRALEVVWHTRMGLRIVSGGEPLLSVLAPVSDCIQAAIYLDSVHRWRRGSVRWKGREIAVSAGHPGRARVV